MLHEYERSNLAFNGSVFAVLMDILYKSLRIMIRTQNQLRPEEETRFAMLQRVITVAHKIKGYFETATGVVVPYLQIS